MLKHFESFITTLLQSRNKKIATLLLTLLILIGSIMMIPTKTVLAKMLPGKNSDTFSLYIDLPNGSSLSQTKSVSQCVISHLQKEHEVLNSELYLGSGAPLDIAGLIKGSQFKNSEHLSEIVVNLSKKHHRSEPSYMMVQRLRPLIQAACTQMTKGTNIKFVEPPAGPPVVAEVVAEIYGNSTEGIRVLSEKVRTIFAKTEGLVDIDVMQDEIYEQFEINVNSEKIAKSHLTIKQINEILYLAFEGMQVAVKNSKNASDQIPLFLTLSHQTKQFTKKDRSAILKKLSAFKLMNQQGMMVPLIEVIDVINVHSNPTIMSKNLRQMSNVVATTDMVSQVYPLIKSREMILDELSSEYTITTTGLFDLELTNKSSGERYELVWDGEMKVTLDTFVELGGAFIAALVLIFLLMVIYYKSYTLSGIILFGSFLSIVGVIVGHWIMDIFTVDTFFLTATSLIGYIALIGISSRNTLLLLDFTKSLLHDKGMHKTEAIAYATATRAKPIFLTAAAIILASTLLAGDAVFGGLGVSLIFGTIAAVIASLIVVPVLMHNSDLEKAFGFKERSVVSIYEP